MNSLKYKLLHTARQLKYKRISSGVPPLTLQNVIAGKLLNYQIYGNSKQGELPDGYIQLEYIESSGEQYIDIGEISLNDYNTKLEYTGQWLSGSNNQRVFSYGGVAAKTNFTAWEYSGGYYMSTLGTENNIESTTISKKHKVVMERTSSTSATFTVDGTLLRTASGTFVSSSANAYLLGASGAQQTYIGKLWYLKLLQNDVLIRNIIPAKNSNGTIGVYDTVTNTFYGNSGTGEFIAGPEMPNPNNPIEIQIVGDKTKNLFSYNGTAVTQTLKLTAKGSKIILSGTSTKNVGVTYSAANNIRLMPGTYKMSYRYISGTIIEASPFYTGLQRTDGSWFPNSSNSISIGTNNYTQLLSRTVEITETTDLCFRFVGWGTVDDLEFGILLENNDAVTPYEPYGYKIPVVVKGKNLWDKENYYESNATTRSLRFDLSPNDYSWIKEGNTITISADCYVSESDTRTNPRISIQIYYIDGTSSNFPYAWYSKGIKHRPYITITIPSNDKEIKIFAVRFTDYGNNSGGVWDAYVENIQIEEGSVVTEYEPYVEPVTTNIYIDKPLLKKDDSTDYTNYGNRKLVRNISNVVLDGTEGWQIQWNDGDGNSPVFSVTGKIKDSKYFATATTNILCANEYYRAVAFDKGSQSIWALRRVDEAPYLISINDTPSNPGKIYLKHLGITTVTDLKAWLAEHNIVLYYVLNEPVEETIELPDILLNKGTNIVDVETSLKPSNIEVEYLSKSKI